MTHLKMAGALVAVSAVTLAAAVTITVAKAEEYPAKEIHAIYGYAPGSGGDIYVRHLAERIQRVAGKPVVVMNRVGASGNIAAEYVAKSKPDGHTILFSSGNAMASSPYLFKNPPYNAIKDFQLFGTVLNQPWMMLVDAKKPWKTVADLTAYLKEKGDKGSYATATPIGTVMGELYKSVAGLETVQVNYRAIADSLNDLLSGSIDVIMGDPVFGAGQIASGRLRALAVSTSERTKSFPDVPTLAEAGVAGITLNVWWAAAVPAATPKPVVDKLNAWLAYALKQEDTAALFKRNGADVFISTPEDAQKRLARELKEWGEYVRLAKIQPSG